MGVSDFSIIVNLAHKLRSIMAELRSSPPAKPPAKPPACFGSAMEIDSGATPPESDVLTPERSDSARRRLFDSPATLRCSAARSAVEEEEDESENQLPEYSDSDSTSMTDSPTRDDSSTPKSQRNILFDREYSPDSDLDFDSDKIWLPPPIHDKLYNEIYDEMCLFDEDTEDIYEVCFDDKINTHFKALVSQLLNGEGFNNETCERYEEWLRIVASLAWRAANFVKPDTKKGGNMDPGYYVKIKCVASGEPSDSELVKGVVCSKNLKHKRMVSQHINPSLLLLEGSLEFQKVSNKLASLNKVLQQEKDHIRQIVEKILALKPHVLLVEKSVSPYAQEILANEISLVLNVKRPLLERISRCTGAEIVSSVDSGGGGGAQLGRCKAFRVEKVKHHAPKMGVKFKTLMFFEGCPKRLGCTVLLRGSCWEELKKIKRVVQLAVFAAYHLSLENSFLADEGSIFPQFPSNSTKNPFEITNDRASSYDRFNERNRELKVTNSNSRINDNHSMLVSMSNRCVPRGIICKRSELLRIKFYSASDKPLGRYLIEDLFDESVCCELCKEPSRAHVRCYAHRQGSLTIRVRRLRDVRLPGEQDGEIWMWHRCLRCDLTDSFPPATRRVVMSRAARGLSFGKFLELSFSNRTTANRVAPCGHSLPRDCLRFYGFGSMVALFQYSPIDILSVSLPPLALNLTGDVPQECIRREAEAIYGKVEYLHAEVLDLLSRFEKNNSSANDEPLDIGAKSDIIKLKDALKMERNTYDVLLQPFLAEKLQTFWSTVHFTELNRLNHNLLIDAYTWDHRLFQIDTDLKAQHSSGSSSFKIPRQSILPRNFDQSDAHAIELKSTENVPDIDLIIRSRESYWEPIYESEDEPGPCTSNLSDQIDSAWTGSTWTGPKTGLMGSYRKTITPVRVHSFNTSLGLRQRVFGGPILDVQNPLHVNKCTNVFGDFPNMKRVYSHKIPGESDRSKNVSMTRSPVYISSVAKFRSEKARFLMPSPETSDDAAAVVVYDDEPTSVISHALTLPPEDTGETHLRVSFADENALPGDRAKFAVTCYFAKQFANLRGRCRVAETDYVRSLCRCKRWRAKGGKSNVYFAKTMDERFVVKQVTKTELESFEDFAAEYFEYVNRVLASESPTCLAKVLGIYQVSAKNMKGRGELRMDLMITENIFFKRNISQIYDLKGSLRSRYNSDTSGQNKVLLDENLLEALKMKPIFLGVNAKQQLERAIWNDTSFLASVDVMDYSLLVGIDNVRKQLVVGIIDFMRQYTWDKQLETLVKASGILGGPKNASPTIISPIEYKKRFRKAMSRYFITMPDCRCCC